MDLPHSSSDLRIANACQICNGNGGFGSRTREGGNPHQPCTSCEGSGWKLKRIPELTPDERKKFISLLTPATERPLFPENRMIREGSIRDASQF